MTTTTMATTIAPNSCCEQRLAGRNRGRGRERDGGKREFDNYNDDGHHHPTRGAG